MEWGSHAKKLEQRIKKGRPTPFWDNRPVLDDRLIRFSDAFWVLHTAREYYESGNPKPLRVSELISYADAFAFKDKRKFIKYLQALDYAYALHVVKKEEVKNGRGKRPHN